MKDFILKLNEICVQRSSHDKPSVDHVSTTFHPGEIVALCGRNGAGKSSLVRAVLGLYPLASGSVTYSDDIDPSEVTTRPIHMVFQPAEAQLVGDTVYEELSITLLQRHASLNADELHALVTAQCNDVGLNVPPETHVRTLSVGQLHRLCIAEAMASGARLILVDEGLSALDPAAKLHIWAQFRRLANENRTSVLVITHDMEDVLNVDRVLVMENGRLIQDLATRDFFYSDDGCSSPCKEMGMRPPYVVQSAISWNQSVHLTKSSGLNEHSFAIKPLTANEFAEDIRRAANT